MFYKKCSQKNLRFFQQVAKIEDFRHINFNKFKTKIIPKTFSTNGYSVSVLFEREIIKSKQKKTNKKTNIHEKFNFKKKYEKLHKKGLFDADNCNTNEEYLNKFHKIGIDPNNKTLLYCYSLRAKRVGLVNLQTETGKKIEISKGYYNEISHINRNKNKEDNYRKLYKMNNIYDKLNKTNYKSTTKISNLIEFIIIIRKNWNKLWNYLGREIL